MKPRRILFVVSHPPHRGALAFEMLDELLVGAVFEQKVSVLFIDEGVFQVIDGGETAGSVARGYRALSAYDVDDVFADADSLKQRGIAADALAIPVRALSRDALRKLVADHDVVVPD